MFNNFKKVLSLLLICTIVLPFGIFTADAKEVSPYIWTTRSGKFASRGYKIITVQENGNTVPKTEGFRYTVNENDGITVVTPTYKEFEGIYGVSAVTSVNTVELDGLSVSLSPREFDFRTYSGVSNHIGILWTEEEPLSLDEAYFDYRPAESNGLRHLIPTNAGEEGFRVRTPASDVKESKRNGKALYIDIHNADVSRDGTTASTVYIVYYDGYYINGDDHPGYRWSFTERNEAAASISTRYDNIDFSQGLVIRVKSDERLGYIIEINGKEYYEAEKIGYFPDAYTNGRGYIESDLSAGVDKYAGTMTHPKTRQDIDLSGLKGLEGYLTVGAVSAKCDSTSDTYYGIRCNYNIDYINGYPAASWQGEAPKVHDCDFVEIENVAETCEKNGYIKKCCTICGMTFADPIDAHGIDENNDYINDIDPSYWVKDEELSVPVRCTENGLYVFDCIKCGMHRSIILYAEGHEMDDWYVDTVATPELDGTMIRRCLHCDYFESRKYSFTEKDLLNDDWEITSENLAFTNLINNGYITEYGADDPIVDAVVNDDGSITVLDTAAVTGKNWGYASVTKAINKNKISLNNFSIEVTPNATSPGFPDKYADTISFAFTNTYSRYNVAAEHINGSKCHPVHSGVPESEWYQFGQSYKDPMYYDDDAVEYSVIVTLIDHLGTMGTKGDGYYEAVNWSVIGGGTFWNSSTSPLEFPIKQGDTITLDLLNYFYQDGQIIILYINDNEVSTDGCWFSQLQTQDYYFSIAAYAEADNYAVEGMKYPYGKASTGFTINSICYERADEFVGWDDPHNCADVYTPGTPIYSGIPFEKAEWITVREPDCVNEGLRAVDCPYCDGYCTEEKNPALEGAHRFTAYTDDGNVTCTEAGTMTAVCDICGVATDVREAPATGHTEGEWVTTLEAKLGVAGEETMYCAVCEEPLDVRATDPKRFIDVTEDKWYYDAVYYCAAKDYIAGNDKGEFMPENDLTREQFVVILARVAGADLTKYKASVFADVKADSWYGPAVIWAADNEYVLGIGDGTSFGVGQKMTREQLAVIFFRYVEKAGERVEARADLDEYKDRAKISGWAEEALSWAVAEKILNSTSKTAKLLDPKMSVTRAQAAQIFMNYYNAA